MKGLVIALAVLLVFIIASLIYVSANKEKIIAGITTKIGETIQGKVEVGDGGISILRTFPWASVVLKNVQVTDSQFVQHQHPFFKAEEALVSFNIFRLISKSNPVRGLELDRGAIYIFTDSTGYSNNYLVKGKKKLEVDTTHAEKFPAVNISHLLLNNFSVIVDDQQKKKYHNFYSDKFTASIENDEDLITVSTKTNIDVKSLSFNTSRGTFLQNKQLKGKFDVKIDRLKSQLFFDSIDINIDKHPYNMTGRFDLGDKNPQFALRIYSKDLSYTKAQELLPKRIATSLRIVQIDKPLDVRAEINGPLKNGDPLVRAFGEGKNMQLLTPFMDFDKASFRVLYNNEVTPGLPRKDPNSELQIRDFKAEWKGLPVVANSISIVNLLQPQLTCDLHSNFEMKKLNELMGSSIDFLKGNATANLFYQGPIVYNDKTNTFLNGDITISGGQLLYTPRSVTMDNINGKLLFKNSNLDLSNLGFTVVGNKLLMNAKANNLLTLINTQPSAVAIDCNISSPMIKLDPFLGLLGERNNNRKSGSSLNKTTNKIDAMLEDSRINMVFNTPRMNYRKFTASNVVANISVLKDEYVLNNVEMAMRMGALKLSGHLKGQGKQNIAKINSKFTNVDVSEVLDAFDNFGQDGIMAQNLSGNLNATVNADMQLDRQGKVLPETVKGTVDFSLKNGQLINFEPLKKMQVFVFKKRDFDNISFAELKNRFEIANKEIKINRMEIQSSVMSLFVEGLFSMKGNTDISIQVPLSNLKKRSKDYIPENIGVDAKAGRSIFLRGKPGSDGKIAFKLDLFNRFKKEKLKAESTGSK